MDHIIAAERTPLVPRMQTKPRVPHIVVPGIPRRRHIAQTVLVLKSLHALELTTLTATTLPVTGMKRPASAGITRTVPLEAVRTNRPVRGHLMRIAKTQRAATSHPVKIQGNVIPFGMPPQTVLLPGIPIRTAVQHGMQVPTALLRGTPQPMVIAPETLTPANSRSVTPPQTAAQTFRRHVKVIRTTWPALKYQTRNVWRLHRAHTALPFRATS